MIKTIPRSIRAYKRRLIINYHRLWWYKYHLPSVTFQSITKQTLSSETQNIITDDICMPPYIRSKHDDFGTLLGLVSWLQPKVILELGTAHGNTVANLCQQLPDAHIYTVNALEPQQSGQIVTYQLGETEIGRVYRNYGFQSRVTQIFEDTLHLDLSAIFSTTMIDLAIIDACHDTNYVLNDFLKVKPFVKSGGIVLFHDTHPSMEKHLIGSYLACVQLRQQGYNIQHIADTWWGIWINTN